MTRRVIGVLGMAALALCAAVPTANAATNLVQNGDFTGFTSGGANEELKSSSTGGQGTVLAGWGSVGYSFVYTQGSAAYTGGAQTFQSYPSTVLWGPGTGVSSTTSGGVSSPNTTFSAVPGGGNFLAIDPVYQTPDDLSQTITGLSKGTQYVLTFSYAGAEQNQGPQSAVVTTEGFNVSFGGSTVSTPTITDAARGFTPWVQQSFVFTAQSASQVLDFVATGTPSGAPPFALLSNVSLIASAVPEPATWAALVAALAGLTIVGHVWRRDRRAPAKLTA